MGCLGNHRIFSDCPQTGEGNFPWTVQSKMSEIACRDWALGFLDFLRTMLCTPWPFRPISRTSVRIDMFFAFIQVSIWLANAEVIYFYLLFGYLNYLF